MSTSTTSAHPSIDVELHRSWHASGNGSVSRCYWCRLIITSLTHALLGGAR